MFEDLVDGMLGLASETPNELTNMKSTVSITRKHILRESKKVADEATVANTSSGEVIAPKIITNNDAQDEADRRNMYYGPM